MLWPFESGAFMVYSAARAREERYCSKVRCAGRCSSCFGPPGYPRPVPSPVVPESVPVLFQVSRSDGPVFPSVSRALRVVCAELPVPDANRRASCDWFAPFARLLQLAELLARLVPRLLPDRAPFLPAVQHVL